PEIADLNNDGVPDLLVADEMGFLHYYESSGRSKDRTPVLRPDKLISAGNRPIKVSDRASVRAVDWDSDGLPDIIMACSKTYSRDDTEIGSEGMLEGYGLYTCWFKNVGKPGKPQFATASILKDEDGKVIGDYRIEVIGVTDWDADGKKDLLCSINEGQIYLYRNVGTDKAPVLAVGAPLFNSYDQGKCIFGPCLADLDADGQPDIVAGSGHFGYQTHLMRRRFFDNLKTPVNIRVLSVEKTD
ncbi:MAG: VCBS repeat-containing protein, partial [Candidatus Omnitrophota bacterium]